MDDPAADLPGRRALALRAGQTLFWDGDSVHRGVPTAARERLTLHACWGSVAASIAAGAAPARRFLCDPRWLHWAHPGVRAYLGGVRGAVVPGALAAAHANFVRSRALPAEVAAWNASRAAEEPLAVGGAVMSVDAPRYIVFTTSRMVVWRTTNEMHSKGRLNGSAAPWL
jgi:hypothetical protein